MTMTIAMKILFLTVVGSLLLIPIVSLIRSIGARMRGRYLNEYFVISYQPGGIYELHCRPAYGFYSANLEKFIRLHDEAIEQFIETYPDTTLFTCSSVLQYQYEGQGLIGVSIGLRRIDANIDRLQRLLLIFRNVNVSGFHKKLLSELSPAALYILVASGEAKYKKGEK